MSVTRLLVLPEEAQALFKPVVGNGGFQRLQRKLNQELERSSFSDVYLTDAELGAVVRHMIQYGKSGGFQGRLRKAFGRELRERLA